MRLETTKILMVVVSFRGTERLNEAVRRTVGLLPQGVSGAIKRRGGTARPQSYFSFPNRERCPPRVRQVKAPR